MDISDLKNIKLTEDEKRSLKEANTAANELSKTLKAAEINFPSFKMPTLDSVFSRRELFEEPIHDAFANIRAQNKERDRKEREEQQHRIDSAKREAQALEIAIADHKISKENIRIAYGALIVSPLLPDAIRGAKMLVLMML